MSKEPVYWTTKDGRKMNVDDMGNNHVRNAFKMVLRNIQQRQFEAEEKRQLAISKELFEPHGDGAKMMHEQMLGSLYPGEDFDDIFDDMEPWDWH